MHWIRSRKLVCCSSPERTHIQVYIVRGSDKEGPVRLLKNTLTDIPVIMTEPGFFFHQDEFETAILRDGYSPITRLPAEKFNESEM